MEGFVGFFNDPDLQRRLQEMAEQMQGAQNIAWADNAIKLAVDMTVAAIDRINVQGTPEQQAQQIRQRAQAMLLALSQEKNLLYQKVGSFRAVASHLEQLERQLRSSMPQHVMDMLGQQAAYGSR